MGRKAMNEPESNQLDCRVVEANRSRICRSRRLMNGDEAITQSGRRKEERSWDGLVFSSITRGGGARSDGLGGDDMD